MKHLLLDCMHVYLDQPQEMGICNTNGRSKIKHGDNTALKDIEKLNIL